MAPKKVTNVENPKKKIIMTTAKFKKVGKWHWTDYFQKKKKDLMMVVVVLVNHNLPLVDSRGDEKAHQKASFYGMYLTFQAVISLHYTFHFYFV
jgi:hypothetical protein